MAVAAVAAAAVEAAPVEVEAGGRRRGVLCVGAAVPSPRPARIAARPAPAITAAAMNETTSGTEDRRRTGASLRVVCEPGSSASRSACTSSAEVSESVSRLLGECPLEDRIEPLGDGRDLGVDVSRRFGRGAVRLEGAPSGEELEGDDPQRVAVARRPGALALSLLG